MTSTLRGPSKFFSEKRRKAAEKRFAKAEK